MIPARSLTEFRPFVRGQHNANCCVEVNLEKWTYEEGMRKSRNIASKNASSVVRIAADIML